MNKKLMHLFLLLSIGLMNGSLAAETSKNIERRIELISTLLTKSSVNKKIKYSGSDVAMQYFKYAQTSFDDAVKEYHRGDIEQADFHLKNSKQAVFEAVMYANLKWTGNDQDRQAYEAKRRSVDALTDALKRVSKTKDKTKESLVIIKKVTELTQQADQKYFRKHYKEALDIVHRGLEIVEAAIASMRTGDTLVNALNFDDDEDEYRYEIDRNDTHFMLLNMFLSEFPEDDEALHKSVDKYESAANKFRKKAEKFAEQGSFRKAIDELEKSTMKIIRAIKSTGSHIPG